MVDKGLSTCPDIEETDLETEVKARKVESPKIREFARNYLKTQEKLKRSIKMQELPG